MENVKLSISSMSITWNSVMLGDMH
jgi:hypothetical protein